MASSWGSIRCFNCWGPLLGRLSDRHGRKPVLTLCLVGVLAGYVLMALGIAWRSLPLLLLSRVVEGFFNGDIAIVQAMAADMSTARTKARNFARINIGMNLGWVVGPMIGGYAAVVSGDYSLAAWLAVGMTVINLLLVLWLLPNRPRCRRPGMRFLSRPANCCCNLVSCPTLP